VPGTSSRAARALRWTAIVWVAGAVVGLAIDHAIQGLLEELRGGGDTVDEAMATLDRYQWTGLSIAVAVTLVMLVLAWSWMPRIGTRGVLGRIGWYVVLAQLLLLVGQLAWQSSAESPEDFELLRWVHLGRMVFTQVGLTLILVGTPGPRWRAPIYAVVATAWVGVVGSAGFSDSPAELDRTMVTVFVLALELGWAAAMWMGAAHCEEDALEPVVGDLSAERRLAASGLRTVRAAFLCRIAIGVVGMALVVASRSSGGGGGMIWLSTIASVGAAIAIGVGLSRYSNLRSEAVGRTAISLALVGLGIGVMLDLVAAQATAELLGWAAKAKSASSVFGMPSMSEAEKIQARVQWGSGLAALAGIVTVVSIAVSLRTTAGWLHDQESMRAADRVIALTMLGAAITIGGVSLATSAAGRSGGVLLGLACIALALAIWLLVAWLSLFAALVYRLEHPSADDVSS
jgi:hypothetical protein